MSSPCRQPVELMSYLTARNWLLMSELMFLSWLVRSVVRAGVQGSSPGTPDTFIQLHLFGCV